MNDVPGRIRVSFDQSTAVRDDGVLLEPVKSRFTWSDCSRCAAFNPSGERSCNISEARAFRFCTAEARKDGRNVYWRPKT